MIIRTIRFWQSTSKTIPSAKNYIDRFSKLQVKLQEQQKRISELKLQAELAERSQQLTLNDQLQRIVSKVSKSTFETEAVRGMREELLAYRNQLERKILECDQKWEKPRNEILRLRKQTAEEFLAKFVRLEQNLLRNTSIKDATPELIEGFGLIHRLLLSTLQKHGVVFYEGEPGTKFDPQVHESAEAEAEGSIIKQTLCRGWRIGGRVAKKSTVRLQ